MLKCITFTYGIDLKLYMIKMQIVKKQNPWQISKIYAASHSIHEFVVTWACYCMDVAFYTLDFAN